MKKRVLSLLLVLLMVGTLVPAEVFAISPDDSSVLLKQNTDYTCTLCSAAMMLRRRAVIDGSSNWSSITENSIRSTAWDENAGLYWQFTYAGMSVGHYQISGSYQSKKDSMISLLSKHPEGIMVYDRDIPHAVLLTSYNSSSDTFYCADPAGGYPSGIIKLASSLLGRNGASQSTVISNIDDYWMITNRSGGSSGSETPSVSVKERVTHGYSVKISANYLLKNYTSELDTNAESKNYVLKKDKAYSLSCSEKVVLSNGTVRYKWVSGDTPPKTLWFEYDSSAMSVSLRHQYTEYNYEAAHPHKYYKKCACGEFYYTGETEKLASCPECNPTGPVTYAVTGGNITFDKATGTITDCDTSVTEANIPSKIDGVTVTSIGYWAFSSCTNLKSVAIPNSVMSIDVEAFYECESLTSVTIPNSVTSIESSAFSGCTSLKSINVANTNTAYCSVNGVLFNKDKIELIIYPEGKTETSYTIPNSVTSIGDRAFLYCTKLKSVAIPNSVTSIGDSAFAGCTNLKSVAIPNSVTSIGDSAFYNCISLKSVAIPNSVTSIGHSAFCNCTSLKSVAIPDSVKSIGKYAFYDCLSMTDVYYSGSETQWKNISGVDGCFDGVIIHFAQEEHTHSYTAVVIAPTCTAAGFTTYTCSCGDSYKDNYTDALGHNYVSGVCTRCNAKDPNYQAPHTHSYTAAVTAPTCTAAGCTTYTCSICGDSYKGSYTDALGHSYVGGVCTRCGAKDPNYKPTVSFIDVPSDAFYANAVKWAVENGITEGVGNNRFDPNGQCTRGQVVTFLWRAAGKPTVSANVSFSDVQPGAFYYEAVKWAVANGITTGVGGNRFAPNDSCTRGQVVTFLHRAANSPAASTISSFTDVPATAFYYNAVNWAVANGITNGTGNGRFSPNDTCTRAQVVTFLYRAM